MVSALRLYGPFHLRNAPAVKPLPKPAFRNRLHISGKKKTARLKSPAAQRSPITVIPNVAQPKNTQVSNLQFNDSTPIIRNVKLRAMSFLEKEKGDVSHTAALASHVLTACDNVHLLGGEQHKLCII